jgi:hypothetical protein
MSAIDTISTFDVITDTHAIETKCRGEGPLTFAAWRRGDLERQVRAVHLGNFDTREAAEAACRADQNRSCLQATVSNGASPPAADGAPHRTDDGARTEIRARDSGLNHTPTKEPATC